MNLHQALIEIENGKKIVRDKWSTDPEYLDLSDKYLTANTSSEKVYYRYKSNNNIVFVRDTTDTIAYWTPGPWAYFAEDYSIFE